MGQLAFVDDDMLFDGECIRFKGVDGEVEVLCGVTLNALQHCDPALPRHGLVAAESFLATFEKLMTDIHQAARAKYLRGEFETGSPIKVMIRRRDLVP
jgi:hypothetical protein